MPKLQAFDQASSGASTPPVEIDYYDNPFNRMPNLSAINEADMSFDETLEQIRVGPIDPLDEIVSAPCCGRRMKQRYVNQPEFYMHKDSCSRWQ